MSYASTNTRTFTVSDIRKVVDCFAADYAMIAQSTGLHTPEDVAANIEDLTIFAEYRYLAKVTIFLTDTAGNKLAAAVYKVSTAATGWISDRPGNNLWQQVPGGSLSIIATLSDSWWNMSETDRLNFVKDSGLHSPWSKTSMDTSLTGLGVAAGQRYASNGYGWERTNYSK